MEEGNAAAEQERDAHAALRDIHDVIRIQATRVAELQAAVDALRRELKAARTDADVREAALVVELENLRRTRLYRWTVVPRRLYGGLLRAAHRRGTA